MPSPRVVMAGTGFAAVRQFLIEALPDAQFDQIEVIFRRPLAYAAHSARVSIERFVLIP